MIKNIHKNEWANQRIPMQRGSSGPYCDDDGSGHDIYFDVLI